MSEGTESGPGSPTAVAWQLAFTIAREEKSEEKTREYWLTLYRQCYKATSGHTLDSILNRTEKK